MLTKSFAHSQVENYEYQLKIIKTYYTIRVLRQLDVFNTNLLRTYT